MIWDQFLQRVEGGPRRCAVLWQGRSISYLELAGMAEALAARSFPAGGDPPRRALIQQSDSFAVLLCLLACWRGGVTPVLMRDSATASQMHELTALLQPVVSFTGPLDMHPLSPGTTAASNSRPLARRSEALVISTSGTTGFPKLVALPAESVCMNASVIGTNLGLTPADRIAVNTPLTYVYGLMGGTLAGLWAGAAVHLFSPRMPLSLAQAQIRSQDVTLVQGPPSLMRLFLTYWNGRPFPSVRIVTTGGERVTADLANGLDRAFPNARKTLVFGMTEAGPRISHDDLASGRYAQGCVGTPFPHIEWRIDPVNLPGVAPHLGRLVLRGPTLFLGYLQTTGSHLGLDEDGFFHTTDLIGTDELGRLYLHGRIDRMFKTGGKLIDPAAIERLLVQHPEVQEVHCHAEAHEILGFVPVADVVPKPDRQPAASDLKRYCETHLDSYAVPRQFRMVSALQLGDSGKARGPRVSGSDG